MFIEERLSALHLRVERLEAEKAEILAAMREQEHRINNELTKISLRTGHSVADLAKLLEAVAANLYASQTQEQQSSPPATKGAAQDDGAPTNKDLIPPAQNGGVLADPPGEPVAEAADGGVGSDQVVAPPVEAPASPAVDEDPSPEKGWDSYIRVVGRVVYAPRAELYVTTQQAQIVNALLSGPKTLDELSAAQNERVNRMTVMRMGSMATTLRDGGLKIVPVNGKYWLRPVVVSKKG